ncbi:MAG: hypothetical protein JWO13_3608 [Acidobacteriales bacterium]|nr:hypothetical protein [Terriglobales bacterium]
MRASQTIVRAVSTAIAAVFLLNSSVAGALVQDSPKSAASRPVGSVKAISGNSITLTTDAGPDVNVQVQDSARIVRIAPGEKDLTNAVSIPLSEIQAGDRIVVRGSQSTDGKSVLAVSVIAIKKTDVAQKKQQDLQDWQKRGSGGLVKSVDPAGGSVVISVSGGIGPSKDLTIHTSKATAIRRYSPDSVKYDDATLGSLDQIKSGDQLRVRGTKNPDGTEMAAEEIVSGAFRNVAGLITAIDTEKKTITVNDLSTKKPITIRIADDSQMHKLPQMAAMMMAARLKGIPLPGGMGGGGAQSNAGAGANGSGSQRATGGEQRPEGQGRGQSGGQGGQGGPGGRQGGPGGGGDMQQMLNRMPAMQFTDFVKGDAVMLVATEGSATSSSTAITLLGGVEPILTASPTGAGTASLLSPWNLGGGAGGDAAAVPQ